MAHLSLEQFIDQKIAEIPGPYRTDFTIRVTKILATKEYEDRKYNWKYPIDNKE